MAGSRRLRSQGQVRRCRWRDVGNKRFGQTSYSRSIWSNAASGAVLGHERQTRVPASGHVDLVGWAARSVNSDTTDGWMASLSASSRASHSSTRAFLHAAACNRAQHNQNRHRRAGWTTRVAAPIPISASSACIPHLPRGATGLSGLAALRHAATDMHVLDYLAHAYKYRHLAASVLAVALLVALVKTYTTTPIYAPGAVIIRVGRRPCGQHPCGVKPARTSRPRLSTKRSSAS
jgi:hypothetical protein